MLVNSFCYGACPLASFPENRKLDQEINNICQNELNPIINFATISNELVRSSTITFVHASTATVDVLTASSGTVKSFMVLGTSTNDDAPTGRLGQEISSTVGTVSFATSGQYTDLSSIVLTAGDWDISFLCRVAKNGATVTEWLIGIGTVSGNSGTGLAAGNYWDQQASVTIGNTVDTAVLASWRVSISGTTTYYWKMFSTYTVATPQVVDGKIKARRQR